MRIFIFLLAGCLAAPGLCQNFVYAYDMDQQAPPQSNLFDPSAYRFNSPSTVRQNFIAAADAAPPVPVHQEAPQPAPRRQQRARQQQAARTAAPRREPTVQYEPARQEPVARYESPRQTQQYQPQEQNYNRAQSGRSPAAAPRTVQAFQLPGNPTPDQVPEGYEIIEIPRSQIDSNGFFTLTQDGQRYQLITQPDPQQQQLQPTPQTPAAPQRSAAPRQRQTTPQPRPPAPENTYEVSPNVYVNNRPSTYEEFLRSLPTPPPESQRSVAQAPGPQLSYQVTPPTSDTSYYRTGSRGQEYQPQAQQYQAQTQQYQPQAQQYQPEQYQPQQAPQQHQLQDQYQQYQPAEQQGQAEPESQRYQPSPVVPQRTRQPAPAQEYQSVPPPQVVHQQQPPQQRRRPVTRTRTAAPQQQPAPRRPPTVQQTPAPAAESEDGRRRPIHRPANIGVASLPEDTDGDGIPGQGGVDYPTLHTIPKTSFSCAKQPLGGYYADLEAACQLVHFCQAGGIGHTFLCPNGTIFNQEKFSCQWWYNVDCASASQYYALNDNLYKVPSTTTRAPRRPQQRQQAAPAIGNNNRPTNNNN